MAVLLDTALTDVAERYQEAERARQLVGTLVDGVRRGGWVLCPAKEWELQDYARDRECRVAIFATDDDVTRRDRRVAGAVALVEHGRIVIEDERSDLAADDQPLDTRAPLAPQVVAALARHLS
jgi:tRNA(Met) C34 N-acetyltransferase TmcA